MPSHVILIVIGVVPMVIASGLTFFKSKKKLISMVLREQHRPCGRQDQPAGSGHHSRVACMAQPQSFVRYAPMQVRSRPWLHNEGAPIHGEGKPPRHRGSWRLHMPTEKRLQHDPLPGRPTSRHRDSYKTICSFFPDARILGAGFLSTDRHTCPRRFFAAFIRLRRFCWRHGCGVHTLCQYTPHPRRLLYWIRIWMIGNCGPLLLRLWASVLIAGLLQLKYFIN